MFKKTLKTLEKTFKKHSKKVNSILNPTILFNWNFQTICSIINVMQLPLDWDTGSATPILTPYVLEKTTLWDFDFLYKTFQKWFFQKSSIENLSHHPLWSLTFHFGVSKTFSTPAPLLKLECGCWERFSITVINLSSFLFFSKTLYSPNPTELWVTRVLNQTSGFVLAECFLCMFFFYYLSMSFFHFVSFCFIHVSMFPFVLDPAKEHLIFGAWERLYLTSCWFMAVKYWKEIWKFDFETVATPPIWEKKGDLGKFWNIHNGTLRLKGGVGKAFQHTFLIN